MTDDTSTVVQRRRLRFELRAAREHAGLTQEQAASAMDWSPSKIIRIEAGAVNITTNDIRALLRYYKVDSTRLKELTELAREARKQPWTNKYRNVAAADFLKFIEYESAASIRREFDHLRIPGLLQTEEYAHAIAPHYVQEDRVEGLVEVRMRRQELLNRKGKAPLLFFILDEAVVRRHVGSPAILRRQIRHLLEMTKPSLTIEVVPFSAGPHSAMDRPFVILEFPDPADRDILYLESSEGDELSEDSAKVLRYREAFEELRDISLGPEGSYAYLDTLSKEMA
jgi:transcriptional regulator with XRE-family HTH domain